MTAPTVSPPVAHAILPAQSGALHRAGAISTPSATFDSAYRSGYQAGLRHGLAEAKVDAALLDAYQRELAAVYAELATERKASSNLRHVLRSRA